MLELEQEGKEQGDWGFKALKQMIKISFRLVSIRSLFVQFRLKKLKCLDIYRRVAIWLARACPSDVWSMSCLSVLDSV